MYFANYIQQAGSGTLEMVKQCKSQGLPEPEFVSERNLEFKTILPRDVFTQDVLAKIGLNERQMKAVQLAKENHRITSSVFKKNFPNLTEKTLYRDLQALVTKKIFKEIGEKKGRTYEFR